MSVLLAEGGGISVVYDCGGGLEEYRVCGCTEWCIPVICEVS